MVTGRRSQSETDSAHGNAGPEYVLVFDIGTYFIRYVLFTHGRQGIPGAVSTPNTAEAFYQALAGIVRQQTVPLGGIALSMPGFIDIRQQRAITAGAITWLYQRQISRELNEHLDRLLPVWMENDANCVAIAEKTSGNAKSYDDFVTLTIGSGVGGAVFLDGHLRRGHDWRAGELGMMLTTSDGPKRTLHDCASGLALAERYAKEFGVPVDAVVPGSLLRRLDEPRVRTIVEDWAGDIAAAVFNIVAMLDPQCVLLGGSICQEPTFLPLVREMLDRNPHWKDFRTPIKRCRHSTNAFLLGAYHAFMTEGSGCLVADGGRHSVTESQAG